MMLATALWLAVLQAPGAPGKAAEDALAQAGQRLAGGAAASARDLYEAVLTSQPGNQQAQDGEVRASEQLALVARRVNDNDSALAELLRAKKFAPHQARLLFDLGVLEDQMGLYHDADAIVEQLLQLTPGDSQALYLEARIKLDLGQLDAAEAAMRAYLQKRPDDATAHYGLGRIFQLRQDDAQARAEFMKSIELNPEQTESHYQLADIALKQAQFDTTIIEAARVLSRNPHHGGALTDAGIAYFRQKQYGSAEGMLRRAIGDAPAYQPAHYYLGLTLARLGRKQESDSELATAAKMADAENSKSAQRLQLKP